MSASEERIKESFDSITMPQGLKESTLQAIEQRRPTKRKPRMFTRRAGFAIAACTLVCALGFGGFSAYATETAVVGIEVNPSIELGVNLFDIVVDARALNEDAEGVLKTLSVVGKSSGESLALITQSDTFMSYVTQDAYVDIYVICDNIDQSNNLVNQGQTQVNALPCAGSSNHVSAQTHNEASKHGMGVSRYEAAQTLVSLDSMLTIEDCESMSLKEIRLHIAELDPDNEYAWQSGGHQGTHSQDSAQNGKHRQGN